MASTSVLLNVRNIQKSIEIYESLGFKVTDRAEDEEGATTWCTLSAGAATIDLAWIGSNDSSEFQDWVSTPLGAGVIVYVNVPDVDKWFARAKKVSVEIESPLKTRSYGRAFTMNDADGYTVSFITEPKKRAAAKPKKAAKKRAAPRRSRA